MKVRFFPIVTETHYAQEIEVPSNATREQVIDACLNAFEGDETPSETEVDIRLLDWPKPGIDTGALMGNATRAASVESLFASFFEWSTGRKVADADPEEMREAARDLVTNLGHYMRFHVGMTPAGWLEQTAMAARMAAEEAREDSDAA